MSRLLHAGRGLTLRSRRGPTAGHQARATGTVYIFCGPGLASRRCSRLTSNVRRRTRLMRTTAVIESNRSTRTQQVKALREAMCQEGERTLLLRDSSQTVSALVNALPQRMKSSASRPRFDSNKW